MVVGTGANLICSMLVCGGTFAVETLKDTSGEWNTSTISRTYANTMIYKDSQSSNSGIRLIYGGSDAAEQVTDSALVDPIGKFLTQGSINNTGTRWVVTASSTNSSSDPITIKEIGMVLCTQDNRGGQEFLLARKVVPARVVQPYETFTFSMAIDFLGASE